MTIYKIPDQSCRIDQSAGQNNLSGPDMRKAVSLFTSVLTEKMLERMLESSAGRTYAAQSYTWQFFIREMADSISNSTAKD